MDLEKSSHPFPPLPELSTQVQFWTLLFSNYGCFFRSKDMTFTPLCNLNKSQSPIWPNLWMELHFKRMMNSRRLKLAQKLYTVLCTESLTVIWYIHILPSSKFLGKTTAKNLACSLSSTQLCHCRNALCSRPCHLSSLCLALWAEVVASRSLPIRRLL